MKNIHYILFIAGLAGARISGHMWPSNPIWSTVVYLFSCMAIIVTAIYLDEKWTTNEDR